MRYPSLVVMSWFLEFVFSTLSFCSEVLLCSVADKAPHLHPLRLLATVGLYSHRLLATSTKQKAYGPFKGSALLSHPPVGTPCMILNVPSSTCPKTTLHGQQFCCGTGSQPKAQKLKLKPENPNLNTKLFDLTQGRANRETCEN